MRKWINLLLCLALAGYCLPGATLAGEEVLRVVLDEERMLLEGRDAFSYTSGELYQLMRSTLGSDEYSLGYWGYAGEWDGPIDGSIGLGIPFGGFYVMTLARDPETIADWRRVTALPLEQTAYPVSYVLIDEPGVPGPFGIEVGMTVEMALRKLPELILDETGANLGEGLDAAFAMRYQDAAQPGRVYVLEISSYQGVVRFCHVALEAERLGDSGRSAYAAGAIPHTRIYP